MSRPSRTNISSFHLFVPTDLPIVTVPPRYLSISVDLKLLLSRPPKLRRDRLRRHRLGDRVGESRHTTLVTQNLGTRASVFVALLHLWNFETNLGCVFFGFGRCQNKPVAILGGTTTSQRHDTQTERRTARGLKAPKLKASRGMRLRAVTAIGPGLLDCFGSCGRKKNIFVLFSFSPRKRF